MKNIFTSALFVVVLLNYGSVQAEPVQFSLQDINGKHHDIKDYAGKWVVVNYWATWCPPCLEEIPELVAFHEKHRDRGAVVLGIDFEIIDKKYLKRFIDESFISYPVFQTKPSAKSPFGMVHGLPTTFLVSPTGEVVASKTGGVTQADLEESIAYFSQQMAKEKQMKK